MKHNLKSLVCLLLVLLLAAAALTGCAQKPAAPSDSQAQTEGQTEAQTEAPQTQAQTEGQTEAQTEGQPAESTGAAEVQELGEGEKLFYFNVTFSNGETASYAIHTDAETVGEALTGLELIDGELAGYGMYVKTVCGETLDWDADGMYWAFYENGEYAETGVDTTPVTDGVTYAFTATKG